MSDSEMPYRLGDSEAPTPVEGLTKLSLKAAMRKCRASAIEAENAATRLLERVSSNPPPMSQRR